MRSVMCVVLSPFLFAVIVAVAVCCLGWCCVVLSLLSCFFAGVSWSQFACFVGVFFCSRRVVSRHCGPWAIFIFIIVVVIVVVVLLSVLFVVFGAFSSAVFVVPVVAAGVPLLHLRWL